MPVVSEAELVEIVARERAAGRRFALANGCFDLLHVGHVRYLEGAAAAADRLIVAVNDDRSVAALKGAGRPIVPAAERAEVIAALRAVDYVVIFPDLTAERLIGLVRPEVHCKGPDYSVDTVPERKAVESYGGRTVIVGDDKQHSTRDLLARAASGSRGRPGGEGNRVHRVGAAPARAKGGPCSCRGSRRRPAAAAATRAQGSVAAVAEWSIGARLVRFRVFLGFALAPLVWWLARPTFRSLWAGTIVAAAGEAVRLWAAGHLQKSREVTASGPYRWCAHPLYAGSALMGAGLAIASARLAPAALILAYLAAALTTAAAREAAFLRRAHGEAYDRYRKGVVDRTRRFSWALAMANREYRAIAGLLAAVGLLALKAARGV